MRFLGQRKGLELRKTPGGLNEDCPGMGPLLRAGREGLTAKAAQSKTGKSK